MTPEPHLEPHSAAPRAESQLPQTGSTLPKNRRPAWIVAGLLSLLMLGFFVRARRASPPVPVAAREAATSEAAAPEKEAEPIAVEVSTARVQPVEIVVSAKGTLVAAQGASAKVAVAAPGRLTRVFVSEGDHVAAGQLLALVDNRAASAASQSAQAALSASLADAQSAQLAVRAAQNGQTNNLRQAQLSLASAITERNGAVRQAEIALRSAQAALRRTQVGARAADVSNALQQAQLSLRAARIDRDAGLKSARNALQAAETDLVKLRAGARPQEIQQAQAAVIQAQATRDRAATEALRVQFLFDKGIKARRELDDAQTALRVAQAGLKSAEDALSLVRAGTRFEDIRAGEVRVAGARETFAAARQSGDARVSQAKSALQLAQSNLGLAALQRPEDVRAARLQVSAASDSLQQAMQGGDAKIAGARAALQAAAQGTIDIAAKSQDARAKQALASSKQADLQSAQVAASASEVRAPLAGTVSRRNLNPGDMADPAMPVVEISDLRGLNLLANLSAEAGGRVQPGMSARVFLADAPGRAYFGRVVSVGQIDPQTNLLSVRVAVPNAGEKLKVGSFASADIVLSTKPLAVVVPQVAVLSRDEKSVVLVAGSDGKAHQKSVAIGSERGGLVEIKSGLKAGERVIGAGAYQLDDGAPIKIVPAGSSGATADATTATASDATSSDATAGADKGAATGGISAP